MTSQVPPIRPLVVALDDEDPLYRLRFRLWQWSLTVATVMITVWLALFGIPILTITAIAVAKHVLVAIYLMGLNIYPMRLAEKRRVL